MDKFRAVHISSTVVTSKQKKTSCTPRLKAQMCPHVCVWEYGSEVLPNITNILHSKKNPTRICSAKVHHLSFSISEITGTGINQLCL